jgi:hypothetical protein
VVPRWSGDSHSLVGEKGATECHAILRARSGRPGSQTVRLGRAVAVPKTGRPPGGVMPGFSQYARRYPLLSLWRSTLVALGVGLPSGSVESRSQLDGGVLPRA